MRHFIPHLQITATHGQLLATQCELTGLHMQSILSLLQLITTNLQMVNRHKQIIPVHKKMATPLLQPIDTHRESSWQQPITINFNKSPLSTTIH